MNKKISIGFGILALIFTALLVIPRFVTLNSWKPQIEKQLTEAIQRPVHIDGDINISILPYPGVTLSQARVANAEWGQYAEMIAAEQITVTVSLLPLLAKKIELSQISLTKPDIHLEVSKDGKENWKLTALLEGNQSSVENKEVSEKDTTQWSIAETIPRINILEGSLSYSDQKGETYNITHFQSSLKTNSAKGPFVLKGGMIFEGRDIEYELDIGEVSKEEEIKLNAHLMNAGQRVQVVGLLDSLNKKFTGQIASKVKPSDYLTSVGPLTEDLTITSDIIIDLVHVALANLKISSKDFKAEGEADVNFGTGLKYNLTLSGFPGATTFKFSTPQNKNQSIFGTIELTSQDLPLLLSWVRAGDAPFIDAKVLYLTADLQMNGGVTDLKNINFKLNDQAITGDLNIDYPQIKAALKTSNLRGWLDLVKIEAPGSIQEAQFTGSLSLKERIDVDCDLSFAGGHVIAKGNYTQLSKSFYFDLDLNYPNLPGLLKAFDIKVGALNLGAANVKLNLTGTNKRVALNDLKGTFGPKDGTFGFDGSATIDLKTEAKSVIAKLNLGPVLLDKLMAEGNERSNKFASDEDKKPSNKGHWPTNRLDFSFLNSLEAEIDLNIEKLLYGGLNIDKLRCPIIIKDSKLTIKSSTGIFQGGSLTTSLDLNAANTNSVNLVSTLVNANLEKSVSSLAGNYVKGGSLDMDLNVNSRGLSISDIISNLQGSHNISAAQGSILGFDAENVVNKIKALTNPQALLGIFEQSKGSTPFNKIVYRSTIRKGVAKIDTLSIEAPLIGGKGGGFINLPEYNMNIFIDLLINAMEDAPSVKVSLSGPLNTPTASYDISALKGFLFNKVGGSLINRFLGKKDGKNQTGSTGDIVGEVLGSVLPGSKENQQTEPTQPSDSKTEESPEKAVKGLLKKLF